LRAGHTQRGAPRDPTRTVGNLGRWRRPMRLPLPSTVVNREGGSS
jgi:hypothetical protein